MWSTNALSPAWRKRALWFFGIALLVSFVLLNKGAYQNFFQDDDYDTLGWVPFVPLRDWLVALISPIVSPNNFRPVGHAYYLLEDLVGFHFAPYVAVIQLTHVFNAVLLWRICRKTGSGPFASVAAAGFFLLNAAASYVHWKPMDVFDLLCTTFCLASLLAWAHGRWLLSLAAFWLAYKAKEPAILLPAALAAYEWWFGSKRRWWRLLPFFAISLSFGLQGVLGNRARTDDYAIRLKWDIAASLAGHYLSRIALVKTGGFLILLLPLLVRDRRVWWGVGCMFLFLIPFLMLPGRIFDVYTYLPLACFSVAIAAIAGASHPRAVPICAAILFTVWAVRDFRYLKIDRRAAITIGKESRVYFEDVVQYAHTHPKPAVIIYSGFPATFHNWGMRGLFQCAFSDITLNPLYIDSREAQKALHSQSFMVVFFDHATRQTRILTRLPGQGDPAYLTMTPDTPIWLLDDGWYPLEDGYRWTKPHVTAHLRRPEGAREMEMETSLSDAYVAEPRELRLSVSGQPSGTVRLDRAGRQTLRWPLPPGPAGIVEVAFDISMPFHDPADQRVFAVPVVSFGFR